MRAVVRFFACAGLIVLVLAACRTPRQAALNPPRLVNVHETDMAIQLFMQASILMANIYGFRTISYSEIQERSERAGFSVLPFMPPESIRATPRLVNLENRPLDMPEDTRVLLTKYGYQAIVRYYINTGLRASQLICRNYILGLSEQNRYLEFIRQEFNIAYGLATGILELVHANRTLWASFSLAKVAIDGGLDAYEEFRFLNIDREAARTLVEVAQAKYAQHFIAKVDAVPGNFTFSDALNAVSVIEYQCTREGIRYLLTRAVNNTPQNMSIDAVTGTVIFESAKNQVPSERVTVVPNPGPATPGIGSGRGTGSAKRVTGSVQDDRPKVSHNKRPPGGEKPQEQEPVISITDKEAQQLLKKFVMPDGKLDMARWAELQELYETLLKDDKFFQQRMPKLDASPFDNLIGGTKGYERARPYLVHRARERGLQI